MTLYTKISEIPLHNWEQLNLTGDYRWLIKKGFGAPLMEDIENAYYNLHDEAAPLTGVKDFMEKWRVLILQRMEARQRLADGDKSAQNWVEHFTAMIDNLMKGTKDGDIVKSRLSVQRVWGQSIDAKNTSYLEYLKIRQLVEEEQARNKSRLDG